MSSPSPSQGAFHELHGFAETWGDQLLGAVHFFGALSSGLYIGGGDAGYISHLFAGVWGCENVP